MSPITKYAMSLSFQERSNFRPECLAWQTFRQSTTEATTLTTFKNMRSTPTPTLKSSMDVGFCNQVKSTLFVCRKHVTIKT